jgi:CHU_C Type IX secretion signal domain
MVRSRVNVFICSLFSIFYFSKSIAQECDFTITIPADITICEPSQIVLDGAISGDYFSFEWNGSDGFFTNSNLTPTTLVSLTTTYTLEVVSLPTSNLIFNGDFESGNSGFTSDYALSTPGYTCPSGNQVWGSLGCEGVYLVGPDASLTHSAFPPCMDHSGSGNMMMINGAPSLQQVWCQSINVVPNTDYIFQAYATSISPNSPAILQFSINGGLLGSPFSLSSATCIWQEFYTIWNSGSNTSIEICITNQNTASGGNDFALDDLFFGALCKEEMAFTVTLSDFILEPVGFDPLSCLNPITTLSVLPLPVTEIYDYNWQTMDGVINTDPMAANIDISAPGTYAVNVTNADGCTHNVDYVVTGNLALPELFITGDTTINCSNNTTLLQVTSDDPISTYYWTLPDGNTVIGNQINTDLPGIYYVTGTNEALCTGSTTTIIVYENLLFQYTIDSIVPLKCNRPVVPITLLNTTPFDSIVWSGPGIYEVSDDQTSIKVDTSGYYSFTFFLGYDCFFTDSVMVSTLPANILYEINNPDTLTCQHTKTDISISSNVLPENIHWYRDYIEIGNYNSLNVSIPGVYTFEMEDVNGCKVMDSIWVPSNFELPTYQATIDSIDCIDNVGGFVSTATDATSFYWEGNNQTSRDKDPIFDQEGSYSLIITGSNGCVDTLFYFLPSSKSFPQIYENIDTITCNNPIGSIDITTSTYASISWVDQYGNAGTSNIISSSDAGIYTITAISSNGCTSEKTMVLPIDTISPTLTIELFDTLTCTISNIAPTVTASLYEGFTWSGPTYFNQNELSPSFDTPGTYALTLIGENGCQTSEEIKVVENKTKPAFQIDVQDLTCDQPIINLEISQDNATGNLYYLISGNTTIEIEPGQQIGTPGIYTLQVVNRLGCDSSTVFRIEAYLDPPVSLFDQITINCYEPKGRLFNKLHGSQQLDYIWSTASGVLLSDTILVDSAQQVSVTTINQYGCKSENTVNVFADFIPPDVQINGNGIIGCNETTSTLLAILANSSYEISWTGPNESQINSKEEITVSDTGRYTLYALDKINGCTTSIYKNVSKQQGPSLYEINVAQPLCDGDLGSFDLSNIFGGTAPYTLLLNNVIQTFGTEIEIPSGSYTWVLIDANDCKISDSFMIIEVTPLTLDAGRDTTIRLFDSYPIQINTNINDDKIAEISWIPSQTLSCDDCPDPVATPLSETRYVVTLIDKNGCQITDDIIIKVIFTKGYIAPNIFNPQSNTGNNLFTIYSIQNSIEKINKLNIYDRWGNLVFTQKDFQPDEPMFGWDGSISGQSIVNGVFVWVAELLYKDQSTEVVKGDVTIIR